MALESQGAEDGQTFLLQLQIRAHSFARGRSVVPAPPEAPSNRWFSTAAVAAGEAEAVAVALGLTPLGERRNF